MKKEYLKIKELSWQKILHELIGIKDKKQNRHLLINIHLALESKGILITSNETSINSMVAG